MDNALCILVDQVSISVPATDVAANRVASKESVLFLSICRTLAQAEAVPGASFQITARAVAQYNN